MERPDPLVGAETPLGILRDDVSPVPLLLPPGFFFFFRTMAGFVGGGGGAGGSGGLGMSGILGPPKHISSLAFVLLSIDVFKMPHNRDLTYLHPDLAVSHARRRDAVLKRLAKIDQ